MRKVIIFLLTIVSMVLSDELLIDTLPNGATLIVRSRDDTEAVALHVWFRVGSVYENYEEKGMAHFLEHMLFNGSEKYNYGEIEKWIESRGGNINAGTSKDFTYYHIEIAHPYWEKSLELIYQLTLKATLDENMIEKEKPIVIEELRRGKDNPRTVLWEHFEKLAYKVSPYRFPIIGYEKNIRKFNREMLEEGVQVPKINIPLEPEQRGVRFEKIEDERVAKAHWIIGWRVPPAGSKEHYTLLLIDQILSGGKTSIFHRELKEKGIVYSILSGDLGRPRDNIFVISSTFDEERYEEVKKKVFEIIQSLKDIKDEDLEEAKRRIINSVIFERERVEAEAYEIGFLQTVLGTLDPYLYFESNINTVRKVDIVKFVERYFGDENYVEVLMVPKRGKEEVSASDIEVETLDNGVTIISKSTKGKGIVAGTIFIRGGLHGENKKGVTNITLSLLLRGSKNYTSYDIASTFEDYGGFIYTSSGDDFSEIGFATKTEGIDEAVRVIKDILQHPLFKEEDIETEKRNVIASIRSKKERAMSFAMEHLRKITYRGTPYETTPLGSEEDVSSITREDILERWSQILKGGNIVVSLVGDMPADEMIERFRKAFEWIDEGSIEIADVGEPINKTEIVNVKREGTQATILCAFNAPDKNSQDYFAFKVFNSLLGSGMTSRLHKELREKKGYAYATYSFYPTRYISPRMFAYVGTSPEKKDDALKDMIEVIKEGKVKEEEIDIAINKIVGDFLLDHQTRSRQSWYLGFYEVMGMGWKMDKDYPERIKKVERKDIERVIERYINNYQCVVVSP